MNVFGGPNHLNAILARVRSLTSAGGLISVKDIEDVNWPICGDTIAKERARIEGK